ncbi:hypothetical protein BOX15_Mlig024298g1 [Macrostomum lignano]|uniref:Serine/threonine-protein kinase 11-interacting protein n=2 Tax=Macrostomum lignano TaxID=282301 RepID=A0A267E6C3_9PLAT|nr:hypothetical protein BOX15_Mlig024298g1 [Macrostomum lignano]
MGSSSSSQHVKCSEEDLLIQLAKCFTKNASSLGPSSCLVLDTPVCARILRCLPRQSQLLLADAEDDEFVSVSSVSSANHAQPAGLTATGASTTEHAKIVEIAIGKAENLELVHNDATIEGQLDLARFHSLVRLRLKSVPMHLLLNLSERRDALRSLDVDSCAATLMSVIELCAGDRTTGAEWPRLRHLRFSGCRLRHLDLSVRYLVALTHLDLSYNQLVRVDELQHLKSLQSLNLSFNRLHRLPSLASLRNLRRIRLAYNFLESLVGLEDLRRLEVLDASNNVICHLALIGDLRRLSRLLSLDLRGNPAATAPDHRAQLLPLLNSREPKRLVLNGRRLTSGEVRNLVHVMKAYPRSVSADDSFQHRQLHRRQQQQQQLARGSVNAGYSTADEWPDSNSIGSTTTTATAPACAVALVHVDADDDNNRPVEDRFADSCDISGRGEGDGCPAPGNFTIECEADVSSADEPAEQGQRQKIGSNKKKASAPSPTGGQQNMREYLAGLRQRYGDGYIVRLNEQQRQHRQLRQQQQRQEEQQLKDAEALMTASDEFPVAVSSTPLEPPPPPPPPPPLTSVVQQSQAKSANLAVPAASSAAPLLAAADANIGDPTPVMDSIGSDVFVLPTSRMPQPEPVKSDTAAAASASVEQELGLIRGHQFLAVQGDTGSAVMLSLAGHLLTIRHPDGRLAEEIDLRKLVALELPSASNSGLQMRLRFDQQQLVRSFQLQEDDPADAGQLASLLSPFAATVPPDRYRCARCEHSFNISEASRSILPCESAHSLSDIREAPVCPSCGSEFIVSTDAAATTAAAKLQASSLGPPAAAVARFFVGSVGTELSAPRVSPPSLDAESVSPDPSSANAAAAEGSASADAFARTPSIVSMDTQGAAGPTLTADFNFGQSATVSESATALGTMDAREESPALSLSTAAPTDTEAFVTATADATTDATAGVPDDDDTKEMLADNVLMFDPTSPEVMDHRLKLHLDLSLLGDGEDAKFAVLLAGCHFLSGKRNSNWEAKRAAILVATTRQLLLLDYCPRSLAGADEDLGRCLALLQKWPLAALQTVRLGHWAGGFVLLRWTSEAQLLAPMGHRAKLDGLIDCLRRHCDRPDVDAGVDDGGRDRCHWVTLADSSTSVLLVVDEAADDGDAEMLRLLALPPADLAEALADCQQLDWRAKCQLINSAPLTSLQSLTIPDRDASSPAGAPVRLDFFPEDGVASWSVVMPTGAARRELRRRLAEPWQLRFGVELPVGRENGEAGSLE